MKKSYSIFHPSVFYFIFLVWITVFLGLKVNGQGNINVNPRRVIFEGQKRIIELNVNNDSQDSAKYVISFVQIRMTEDGVMQWITTPDSGQKFADKYVRVFPRTVLLGPGNTQIVRLQMARTDQLESGEYRSHLYFKSLVPQKALGAEDINKNTGVFLNIEATFGLTIPVIIRVGESTTFLKISNIKVESVADGTKKLQLTLNRTGNMSLYGEVTVFYISPGGKETQIGILGNVAVYTPNTLLNLTIDLDKNQNFDLSKGKIRVVYSSKSGVKTEKIAEAELVL